MGDLSVCLLLFKEKIMFKGHLIKSNHRVLVKNKVYTYRALVFHLTIVPLFSSQNVY
jgi:hypothetical protein